MFLVCFLCVFLVSKLRGEMGEGGGGRGVSVGGPRGGFDGGTRGSDPQNPAFRNRVRTL